MAGIGFVLRKLSEKYTLGSNLQSYFHATLASSGPWIFTSLALAFFFLLSKDSLHYTALENFRTIILYNFGFSLVISSLTTVTSTRYLADAIYTKRVEESCGMLLSTLFTINLITFPLGTILYFYIVDLSPQVAVLSLVNLMIITSIWQCSIFLTALKDYQGVSFSFLLGLLVALFSSLFYLEQNSEMGILLGFNFGLGIILSSICALIFAEYPASLSKPFHVFKYFKKYWDLALGGVCYTFAIWIDKWIMWTAPEAQITSSGFVTYPHYDSAMFIAQLSIIPALSMFIISLETQFYEKYLTFYENIQEGATYEKIHENHLSLVSTLIDQGKKLLLFQGGMTLLAIITVPKIIEYLNMSMMQISMLRFGILGAMFQIFLSFTAIILSYFDKRRTMLKIYVVFLVLSIVFNVISRNLGFAYYGLGYPIATITAFVYSTFKLEKMLRNLPYYAFIKLESGAL